MSRRDAIVSLGGLEEGLRAFQRAVQGWSKRGRQRLVAAHKRIGYRHKSEAVKRVPVDESRLKPAILTSTFEDSNGVTTETGTNVPYGEYVEFGTRYIAGGRVLALGPGVIVTDTQAIKLWPAKVLGSGAIGKGGFRSGARISTTTGKANTRVVAAIEARMARGGSDEQMPWLRPAFESMRRWAIQQIDDALAPPAQ